MGRSERGTGMTDDTKRILIADDDKSVRRLLRCLLSPHYDLAEAETGEQALTLLSHFSPNLVILDIIMPGIDGHETCRRMRASPFGRAIQVMMVSGQSSREEQDRAYAAGADDYVTKPFDSERLLAKVRKWLPEGP